MPRPDKPITPGRLDSDISSSRAHRWSKRGGPETVEDQSDPPSVVDIVVDDITVSVSGQADDESKYSQRASSAHIPDLEVVPERAEPIYKWVVDRSIEGRVYRRTDALIDIKVPHK
jgi:hypothetical protein